VVVADCDEGPEAAFLLRTARELKPTATLFALAIASATAKLTAGEIGAHLVLTKPISPEPCKYDLLLCDHFLGCLRTWLAGARLATVPEIAVRPTVNQSVRAPLQESSATPKLAARPVQPSPPPPSAAPAAPVNLTFATLERGLFRSGSRLTKPTLNRPGAEQVKAKHGPNKTLWTTTLGVAFLSIGYLSSQPARVENFAPGPPAPYEQALTSQASEFPEHGNANIKVIPVYRTASPQPTPSVDQHAVQGLEPSDQSQVSAVTADVYIPQSIQLPQPGADVTHNASAKSMPSLLGELEPVTLSEDSSEALLLQKVQPSYPAQALRAGLQGAVVLQASIARDGSIRDLKLVQGSLLLGQAAYKAVKQWRYKPYLMNGKAMEAQTFVTVDFRLPQQSLLTSHPH